MNKALIINDAHIPYHGTKVLETIIYPVIRKEKFTDIIIAGDWLDCYKLSDFDRNPDREGTFDDELDTGIQILGQISKYARDAKKVFIPGNHEDRHRKQMWRSKGYSSLKKLRWDSLLDFKDNGFTYVEGLYRLNRQFIVCHGTLVNKHAGYTAKNMKEKYGVSGISGHTHRMGQNSHTNMMGTFGWWENGHLSDMGKTEYVHNKLGGVANWQQGLSIIHYSANRYHVESIHITNGRCVAAGKIYG